MTTDEIEAAAGRLRRLAAGELVTQVWPAADVFGSSLRRDRDRAAVADACLAANPADDSAAIDAAWLDSVGGDDERGDGDRAWRVGPAAKLCVGRGTAPGLWHCWVREGGFDDETVTLPLLESRAQLRRLLAALGVPAARGGAA